MSANYHRACTLQIDALGKSYVYDVDGLRLRFTISQSSISNPDIATIKLTNMNRSLAEALCKNAHNEGTFVRIAAGYSGTQGQLFKGHIVQALYLRESPTDTVCEIQCTDGDQARYAAVVNTTLPAGSTPRDMVNAAIAAMSKYAVSLGFVGQSVDLSEPVYPRPIPLFGMAWRVFDRVAKSKKADWSISDLKVNILGPADYIPGGAIVLNSDTGLVGMPVLTFDGVVARVLINPSIKKDHLVEIDQSLIQGYLAKLGPDGRPLPGGGAGYPVASIAADGKYRVVSINVIADTRGKSWFQDILAIKPGETTPVTLNYDRQ